MMEWKWYAPSVEGFADKFIGTITERFWVAKTALKKSARRTIWKKSGNHTKSRKECIGTNKATKLLIAFAVGQITQLILHGMVVSLNMWDSRRVIFCAAGGFVILFAVVVGTVIAKGQDEKLAKEFSEKKSYLDWAEVPEKNADEVVNPFDAVKK